MRAPHRIEHDSAQHAPLDGNVQRLIMRIADRLRPCAGLADGVPVEQPLCGTRPVTEKRSLADITDRLPPEFQALTSRGRAICLGVFLILDRYMQDTVSQIGRTEPDESRNRGGR